MVYKIGIYDSDFYYMVAFMEYVNSKYDNRYKVSVFSSEEAVIEYIEKYDLDILLINETYQNHKKNIKTLLLSDERDKDNVLYKYQNVEIIINYINDCLKQKKKTNFNISGIIGVYSPIGRTGKTTLSLALCYTNKNAIYLNLEDYPSEIEDLNNINNINMKISNDKLLYYIATENKLVVDLVEEMPVLKDDNTIKIISGPNEYGDSRMIGGKNLRWFFDTINNQGAYNLIVADIGCGALDKIEVLASFDKIFVPYIRDKSMEQKIHRFEELAKKHNINYQLVDVPNVDYKNQLIINKLLKD